MIVALLLFIAAFALAPKLIERIKDSAGPVVATIAVAAAACWILGAIFQAAKYGTVTAPCCQ